MTETARKPGPTADRVIARLRQGPAKTKELVPICLSRNAVNQMVFLLRRKGYVIHTELPFHRKLSSTLTLISEPKEEDTPTPCSKSSQPPP